MPLSKAEASLLGEGRLLSKAEVLALAGLPLGRLPELVALAHRVRLAFKGEAVELESLLNAKSGGCPEDCAFCSQAATAGSGVVVHPLLDPGEILEGARASVEAGASQFCLVIAARAPSEPMLERIVEGVRAVRERFDLEIGCSLGLLTSEQARRLKEAGVSCYNHNLETCRELFPSICSTHRYEDRLETCRNVRMAGMDLCCGGIFGLGESLEQRIDLAFELRGLEPCEVPINFLDPRPGTPLGRRELLSPREALQTIALFRLVLPSAWIRLAGGRELVLGELQAMGLYAGANGLVIGNYLTTAGRGPEEDHAMLASLGMPPARPRASRVEG